MKAFSGNMVLAGLAICVFPLIAGQAFADKQSYLSPAALAACKSGKVLYVAEATAGQVAVFDVAQGQVMKVYPVGQCPSGIAVSGCGKQLYVTGASPEGKVHLIDMDKGKVVSKISVGHTPTSPVLSPDGTTLYVCNQFNDNVSVVDLAAKKQTRVIPVVREPVAAAITPDGQSLVVANLIPSGAADKDYAASAVSIIDTDAGKSVATVNLPNGSMSLRGVCISPDGKYAYITHILARYQLPTTQLERGWMNTNALSIIDIAARTLVNTVLLDNVDLGAANPWGVACTADGKYICATHAGTHEISVIDRAALHDKLERVAAGEQVTEVSLASEDVPNDLSFLVGIRRRIKLTGNGPRSIVIIGTRAYVGEYFTDSIGVVDINPDIRPKAQSLSLGSTAKPCVVRTGEKHFHDATLCFQYWQSCVSCHPGVRVDGLNWDLLNDGMGNPKNTKSLLLAHETPPAMISGVRGNAEAAVRAGIRHIQFAVRPEEDAVAIDEYLKSLEPVRSPHLAKGMFSSEAKQLNQAAKRGRKLFVKAGCDTCHSGPHYTDMKKYNVGTGLGREEDIAFDTPTLVEVWRTAPYLHDGRATTVEQVLGKYNEGDKHGQTSDMTLREIRDLAEYVRSL
jgi:YVTN family beta-propeller protein